MTGVPALLSWRDVELSAPEIARLGMARLNSAHLALLGTLRRDGSPRISPIEPYFAQGQLLVGAMAWSAKAADLRRDPRYVLHSVVTGPDGGEGELKLYGSAGEAGQDLRGEAAHAWWLTLAPEKAVVFTLHISQAVFIDWDIEHGLMTTHRWSPASGYAVASVKHLMCFRHPVGELLQRRHRCPPLACSSPLCSKLSMKSSNDFELMRRMPLALSRSRRQTLRILPLLIY